MSVELVWVGAASPTSAWVRGKVVGSLVRLAVATNAELASAAFYGPVTPTADGVASIVATGLTPNLRYHFALEVDGVLETAAAGQFRTHPPLGDAASFTFLVGGDTGGDLIGEPTEYVTDWVSNRPVLDTVRRHALDDDALFFAHIGDLHYRNLGSDSHGHPEHDPAAYRQAFDDVATYDGTLGLDARMGRLMRDVAWVHGWDDHDFGPNNSTRDAPGRLSALQVYRERVPHHSLAFGGGANPIDQAWQVGRVQFLLSDTRSERVDDETVHSQAQLDFYESLLAGSDAEFLIWLYPNPWNGVTEERIAINDMLVRTGWSDRMLMISADMHALALDDGANHPIPGASWPRACFAALDAASAGGAGDWLVGPDGGRDRYGSVRVDDDGEQITIAATGWIGGGVWNTLTITRRASTTPGDDGGTQPPRQDIAVPVPRQEVTWLACNLLTGRIITELPNLTGGNVQRILGKYTSTSFTLPIPLTGPDAIGERAFQATAYGRTFLVPVVNDVPSAGFIILRRKGGTDATLALGCASLEVYLNRRYTPTLSLVDTDEADIARALVQHTNTFGIGYEIDAPRTGTLRTRRYKDSDDHKVYRDLRELMGVRGGPEWTVDVDWADGTQREVAKIFRLRKRIGQDRPAVLFDSQSESDTTYTYDEDYTDGKGANHVTATSSGEGNARPEGDSGSFADNVPAGWPLYEQRITPSTSIKNEDTLVEHARAERDLTLYGARTFDLENRWWAPPRLNVDYKLGDTVQWEVVGHRHPAGFRSSGRIIGWDLNMVEGNVKPIILDQNNQVV